MDKNDKVQRPLILAIEEAKARIADAVNASIREGIPCYLLQEVVGGIYTQVSAAAARELAAAREEFEKQTEKKNKTEGSK